MSDNRKLRTMDETGFYQKPQRQVGEAVLDSQVELFDYFANKAKKARKKQQKKESAARKKIGGRKRKKRAN